MSLAVLADHMASKGRGPDSMLIHMSPREVQGLQALAMEHGGSLTINPHTGLPEAGFLDKLLPAIIGFAINTVAPGAGEAVAGLWGGAGGAAAGTAALVGGVQAARTGSIAEGVQAGLGAYGGANLAGGVASAGLPGAIDTLASTAGAEAERQALGQGLSAEAAQAIRAQAIEEAGNQATAQSVSRADVISKGFDAASKNPMQFAKDNWKSLAGIAVPAILAGENVKSGMPKTVTKPGEIHSFDYNPYGGTFERYASVPTAQYKSAASGGIMGFDESSNSPMSRRNLEGMGNKDSMFNYAHDGGGVMKMAEGGIAHYAIGGDTKAAIDAAYAAGDYGAVQNLVQQNQITAADVANTYKGFDTSGLAGLGINLYNPAAEKLYQDTGSWEAAAKARDDAANAANLATWNAQNKTTADANNAANTAAWNAQNQATWAAQPIQYTDAQIGKYLTDNPNVDIAKAITETRADPAAVNRYIASLDNPFRGSTETTGGSGTLGIYNQMKAQGIDPNELYAASLAVDPKYAGWSQADITRGYNLDKGAYALSDQLKGNVSDKDWVKFMDDNKYSINDAAQAFGLPIKEVRDRYNAVKSAETKVVTQPVAPVTPRVTNLAGVPIIPGVNDYGLGGKGTFGALESIYGPAIPPGVSGAGITTVNPNGTITTRPNIPGIPEGGFTGMTDLRNAYTKGGGSLGYVPYTPKTIDEFNAKYKNTGGSKQAMDYLTGKAAYSATPYTPTGEIQKPYWESVGRFPENRSTKKFVFVDGKYQLNPDYVKPSYVQAAEKSAALTKQDTKPTYDPGTGNEWVWDSTDSKWKAQPIGGSKDTGNASSESSSGTGGQAEGGLAALTMARGGTTHMPFFSKSTGKFTSRGPQVYADGGMPEQFNLGGYSDGGRLLRGPGDGVSDSIPATIGNKRPARLADGEFVVPARIVSELGNGSTEAGARKLYAMMDRVQAARKGSIGRGKVANNSRADKYLPA